MAIAWWFDTGIHYKMASDISMEYGSLANSWQRPTIRGNVPLGFSHVAPTALIYGAATFLSIIAFAVEIFKKLQRKNSTKEREKKQKQLLMEKTRITLLLMFHLFENSVPA